MAKSWPSITIEGNVSRSIDTRRPAGIRPSTVDSILGVGAVAGASADLHDVVLGDRERVEPGRHLAAVRIPAPE